MIIKGIYIHNVLKLLHAQPSEVVIVIKLQKSYAVQSVTN